MAIIRFDLLLFASILLASCHVLCSAVNARLSRINIGLALTDTSLSSEKVTALLEAVEDKNQVEIGRLSVEQILSVKRHSIENCLVDKVHGHQYAQELYELGTKADGHLNYGHGPIVGLIKFYQDNLPRLIEYCCKNIVQVFDASLESIGKEDRARIAKLVSFIPPNKLQLSSGDVESAARAYLNSLAGAWWKLDMNKLGMERVKLVLSCKRMRHGLELIEEFKATAVKEFNAPADLFANWLKAKKVCDSYLH